jgi:hypothetical protein
MYFCPRKKGLVEERVQLFSVFRLFIADKKPQKVSKDESSAPAATDLPEKTAFI